MLYAPPPPLLRALPSAQHRAPPLPLLRALPSSQHRALPLPLLRAPPGSLVRTVAGLPTLRLVCFRAATGLLAPRVASGLTCSPAPASASAGRTCSGEFRRLSEQGKMKDLTSGPPPKVTKNPNS
jgi:hypothetical protein